MLVPVYPQTPDQRILADPVHESGGLSGAGRPFGPVRQA